MDRQPKNSHTDLNVMPHENYTNNNDLDIEFTLPEIKQAVFSQNQKALAPLN